jgi:hypothetical protein
MSKAKEFIDGAKINEDFASIAAAMDTHVVNPLGKIFGKMDKKEVDYKKVEKIKIAAAKVMGDLLSLKRTV